MQSSSRDGFTVVQVNEDCCHRSTSQLTWGAIVGIMALTAACTYSVPSTLNLLASVTTSQGVKIGVFPREIPSTVRPSVLRATQFAVPSVETEIGITVPQVQSSSVAAMFGGVFIIVGAALAFANRVVAPKPEALALLPMTGMTSVAEDTEEDGLDEIFTFENLRSAPGSRHRKKRKGRGHAAGQGATCGFGTRGQKSRKGSGVRPGFEGGQNPLWRRMPKLRGRELGPGHTRTLYQMVSLLKLADAAEGATVQLDDRSGGKPILFKVGGLRSGEEVTLPKNLTVKAHAFTGSARTAIDAAGGKCIVIDKYSRELDADGKVIAAEKVAMASVTGQVAYYKDSDCESESDMYITDVSALSEDERPDIAMFATTAVRSVKVGKYKEPTPLSTKMSPKKKAIIDQVNGELSNSFLVFGFAMDGYTMAQITKLRVAMPAGVKIQVVKNTLFRMAARGTGFEALDPLTMGSKAWVFVPEACFQDAIKAYGTFLKEQKKLETNPILGGSMEATLLDKEQVIALGDMPTKKELITQLARLIKGIPTKVAYAVKATPRKLAVAIKLATEKDEEKTEEKTAE